MRHNLTRRRRLDDDRPGAARHPIGGIVLVLALGAVALPPAAATASVTIGSNLAAAPNGVAYDDPTDTTLSQRNLVATHRQPAGVTAPGDGVIVRFAVRRAAGGSAPVALRVIRPGGDALTSTGAGSSAGANPPGGFVTSFGVNPGMPIHAGDGIGLDGQSGDLVSYLNTAPGLGSLNIWESPALADGGPSRSPRIESDFYELLLQATIEPDADGDRLGDETQDPDGGHPGAPAFSASPSSLSFGNRTVGTTSAPRQVTVTNSGSAALSISSVVLAGNNPDDYVITSNGCGGQTLAPGATCTVAAAFRPKAAGSRTASLRFTDNAPGSPHSVALSGRGCSILIGSICL